MKQLLNPGKYILAVSGGVDSVILLNMLSILPDVDLVVAHFDHGIRSDSKNDREFVQKLAKQYNLPFEFAEGNLGANASEDEARQARYKFLSQMVKKHVADAIVTAHHQDDVIETIILNIMRGTKRKGLSSLRSTETIVRPLIGMSKQDILDYAKKHDLKWREDSTNQDETILRNWVRKNIVPKLSDEQREQLVKIYESAEGSNSEIESILASLVDSNKLDKSLLINLEHKEATELVAHWLRENGVREFSSKQIEMIVINAKTLGAGKTSNVNKKVSLKYGAKFMELIKE